MLVGIYGKWIEFPHTPILVCYRGSQAHGTYVPPEDSDSIDDVDLLGVSVPSLDYYFGSKSWEGKDFWDAEYDVVTYSFKKFVHLLTKGNPNCVGILWTKPEHVFLSSALSERLVAHRNLFLGKETVVKSFKGYAAGQMHKMTHFVDDAFYAELDDLAAQMKAFGIYGMAHDDVPMRHRELAAAHNKLKKRLYSGYMGEKRKALVDEFGYDTKNASHLIRLLKMCVELLDTCEINVYREHDADMLIDIKKGGWRLEDVSELAEDLFAQIRDKYDACPLPEQPDREAINTLTTDWLAEYYLESYGYRAPDRGDG